MSRAIGRVAAFGTAIAVASTPLFITAPAADAAKPLACHASVSDSSPSQYSNVYVRVKTAGKANVRAVAHYKTTSTGYGRKANSSGQATVPFYVSGATPGYRVNVTVTVHQGRATKTCFTSFVPHH